MTKKEKQQHIVLEEKKKKKAICSIKEKCSRTENKRTQPRGHPGKQHEN